MRRAASQAPARLAPRRLSSAAASRRIRKTGDRVELFYPEHSGTRSQDLEPAYHDAGQFYWCRPEALRAGRPLLGPTAAMYPVDRARAQDIDTPDDWAFAEMLYQLLQQDGEE